jgi:hypothetical protein
MALKNQPTTPTLEQEAARLNTEITRREEGVVPLYLELGSVLVRISEQRKFDWQGLLAYAAGTLNLRRSRCTRALRIYRLHKDDPSKCKGMTLFEALDQERGGKFDPQPVGARMTDGEYRLAQRYEQAMGTKLRAFQILEWYIKGYTPQDLPGEVAAPDETAKQGKPQKSKHGAKRPAPKARKVASSKKSR